jgi:hypothetical protein
LFSTTEIVKRNATDVNNESAAGKSNDLKWHRHCREGREGVKVSEGKGTLITKRSKRIVKKMWEKFCLLPAGYLAGPLIRS